MATDAVLDYLTLQEGYRDKEDGWLVPKLETLRPSGKLYFSAQAVTKLIHSRWWSNKTPSSGALPSRLTSSSDCPNTAMSIPPNGDGRTRTLRSVYILPQPKDIFDSDVEEKNELLVLTAPFFDSRPLLVEPRPINVSTLDYHNVDQTNSRHPQRWRHSPA